MTFDSITPTNRQNQYAGALSATIDGALRLLKAGLQPERAVEHLERGKAYAESLQTDGITEQPCRSCGRLLREAEAKIARDGCCSTCGPGPEWEGPDA